MDYQLSYDFDTGSVKETEFKSYIESNVEVKELTGEDE